MLLFGEVGDGGDIMCTFFFIDGEGNAVVKGGFDMKGEVFVVTLSKFFEVFALG